MEKRSINLIISEEKETIFIRRLKIIFPILAAISLSLFLAIWVMSMVYVNANVLQFNYLKAQIEQLEQKLSDQKSVEGIYTLSLNKVEVLRQVISQNKNFAKVLGEISGIKISGIDINEVSADSKGNLSFSVSASSSASLDDLVNSLTIEEDKKLFSNIEAQSIFRNKLGKYNLMVSLKINPLLFK